MKEITDKARDIDIVTLFPKRDGEYDELDFDNVDFSELTLDGIEIVRCFSKTIKKASFRGEAKPPKGGFAILAFLENLEYVDFYENPYFKSDDLRFLLPSRRSLKCLDLGFTNSNDSIYDYLKEFKLKELGLRATEVTRPPGQKDGGWYLRGLDMSRSSVKADSDFSELQFIDYLNLNHTAINEETCYGMGLLQLKEIALWGCPLKHTVFNNHDTMETIYATWGWGDLDDLPKKVLYEGGYCAGDIYNGNYEDEEECESADSEPQKST